VFRIPLILKYKKYNYNISKVKNDLPIINCCMVAIIISIRRLAILIMETKLYNIVGAIIEDIIFRVRYGFVRVLEIQTEKVNNSFVLVIIVLYLP